MKNDIKDYLDYIILEKNLTKNTKDNYSLDLNDYVLFLNKRNIFDSKDIKTSDITSYLEYLYNNKLSPRSIKRHLTSIKNFHKYLVRMNKLETDVSEFVDSPKIRKKLPNVLDTSDIDKIMTIKLNNSFDYRNKAMLELIYGAGLRVSELISLTLYSVDLENCVIRITGKGRKERIVPIGEYIIDSLKNYLEIRNSLIKKGKKETDVLFLNNHGEPITRQGFNLILKKILKEKGIKGKITPHTLRHSFATHMIDNGSDIRIVQELLGHSNIETTKIYTHISREKINDDYKKFHPRNNL